MTEATGKGWWEDGREWVRHKRDGQRGYIVVEGGEQRVMLDRPNEPQSKPYNTRDWQPELEGRPLTVAQAATVAFEADKAFCHVIGDFEGARREWLNLRDSERLEWMRKGPEDGVRFDLWAVIMRYLKEVRR